MHRSLQHLNLLACNKRIDEHRDESEQQDVKGELDVRHSRILPLVHGDDIERIEQGRTHHQRKTSRAQLIVSIALIEQAHTRYCQEDSQGGGPRHLLMEEYRHQDCRHDRIDKEDGTGNTCRHVVETHIECGRRKREHATQRSESDQVSPLYLETLLAEQHHHGKHHHSQEIAVDEYRTGIESIPIKFQRTQRIGTITHSGYNTRRKALNFITACH